MQTVTAREQAHDELRYNVSEPFCLLCHSGEYEHAEDCPRLLVRMANIQAERKEMSAAARS